MFILHRYAYKDGVMETSVENIPELGWQSSLCFELIQQDSVIKSHIHPAPFLQIKV